MIISEIISAEIQPFGSFGTGWHYLYWLESKFLKYFLLKSSPLEVLALAITIGTGWNQNF
jgi:hypothetical protein